MEESEATTMEAEEQCLTRETTTIGKWGPSLRTCLAGFFIKGSSALYLKNGFSKKKVWQDVKGRAEKEHC